MKVRTEYPDGRKQFYEGDKDNERKVRVEYGNGTKRFYSGDRGHEKETHAEKIDDV